MKYAQVIIFSSTMHSADGSYTLSKAALAQLAARAIGVTVTGPNGETGKVVSAWADDEVVWADLELNE